MKLPLLYLIASVGITQMSVGSRTPIPTTFAPSGSQTQYLQITPNNNTTLRWNSLLTLQSVDYIFDGSNIVASGSLGTSGTNKVITLTPCPLGISPNEVSVSSITTFAAGTITNATNASPIEITDSVSRATNDFVTISGVTGNLAANGYWQVTNTGANTYTLNGSVGSAAYVSGGNSYKPPLVVVGSALPITANGFVTLAYTNNSTLNAVWPISYVNTTSFNLIGAATATATTGGVVSFDNYHSVYISGGTGTAEGSLIQGGSCVSGGTTGTIRVDTVNTHTGGWSVSTGSGGIREAIQSGCTSSGCTILLPGGEIRLYDKLIIGDGDVYTQAGLGRSVSSSYDRVAIIGQGKGTNSGISDLGTVLNYFGATQSGGAVEVRGTFNTELSRLKINASRGATNTSTGLLVLGSYYGRYQDITIENGAASVRGLDVNSGSNGNTFDNVDVVTQGASALAFGLGTDGFYPQYGLGNSQNLFRRMTAFGGSGASGLTLYIQAADNNLFENVVTFPGSGAPNGLFFQAPTSGTTPSFASFPTENSFIQCPILGGIQGAGNHAGAFATNVFLPYPVSDGAPIPTIAGVFGVTTEGQWFGAIPGTFTGTTVASATTIVPTGQQFLISGTTTVNTITPPYAPGGPYPGWEGCITMIPTGVVPFVTGGNIAANLTATVNTPVIGCYVVSTSLWYLK